MTDRNEIWNICSACVVIAKYVFSFEYVEKSQAAAKKVLPTPRKMSMYISIHRNQVCIFPIAFQGRAKYVIMKIPPVDCETQPGSYI